MRRAIIRAGVVDNVILLEDGVAWAPPVGTVIFPANADTAPGDLFDGVTFTKITSAVQSPAVGSNATALDARQAGASLDDLDRAIDSGETETALRLVRQLLQGK